MIDDAIARACATPGFAEKFWARSDRSGECWVWIGRVSTSNRYGRMSVAHSTDALAHRVAWCLAHGSPPGTLEVMHSCDNPPCVNPAHLSLGTAKDNALDSKRKGRRARPRGMRHPSCKLTESQVVEIRRMRGCLKQKDVAAWYGVSRETISAIQRRVNWPHVP